MGAAGGGRQARGGGDNTSSSHLNVRIQIRAGGIESGP